MQWQHKKLAEDHDYIAPDGSEIRLLVGLGRADMAHFRLAPGRTSAAVAHHTIEEFWFVVGGRGEMWLKGEEGPGRVIPLEPDVSVAMPPGTHFQFRAFGEAGRAAPLEIVAVSAPPWPGANEAYPVEGRWPAEPKEE